MWGVYPCSISKLRSKFQSVIPSVDDGLAHRARNGRRSHILPLFEAARANNVSAREHLPLLLRLFVVNLLQPWEDELADLAYHTGDGGSASRRLAHISLDVRPVYFLVCFLPRRLRGCRRSGGGSILFSVQPFYPVDPRFGRVEVIFPHLSSHIDRCPVAVVLAAMPLRDRG